MSLNPWQPLGGDEEPPFECDRCSADGYMLNMDTGEVVCRLHFDREPQTGDGPDYHADHRAWKQRQQGYAVMQFLTWVMRAWHGSAITYNEYCERQAKAEFEKERARWT